MKEGHHYRTDRKKIRYGKLFFDFFRVGLMAVGGGYAMLPVSEKVLVHSSGYLSMEEFLEEYALAQSMPGVIMANTAALVGGRIGGFFASAVAVSGIIIPSILMLSILSLFFEHLGILSDAFAGIRILVLAMLCNTLIKLMKLSAKSLLNFLFAAVQFLLLLTAITTPIHAVLIGIVAGVTIAIWRGIQEMRREEK